MYLPVKRYASSFTVLLLSSMRKVNQSMGTWIMIKMNPPAMATIMDRAKIWLHSFLLPAPYAWAVKPVVPILRKLNMA